MTGYGTAEFENDEYRVFIEIKTLNSKFLDIMTKLPKEVSAYENEMRRVISDVLVRGKVNYNVEVEVKSDRAKAARLNQVLFENYKHQIYKVAGGLKVNDSEIFLSIMNMPDIFDQDESEESLDQKLIADLTKDAALQCDAYRLDEGVSIERAMEGSRKAITDRLSQVRMLDPIRKEKVKKKIMQGLKDLELDDKYEPNRFEQEMIYYIEKLDISEEEVRLANHLEFFHQTLQEKDSQGKKLGFISQEMGREINTIGSKANDSEIQKLVVEMKDELEKIKEQVLNVV